MSIRKSIREQYLKFLDREPGLDDLDFYCTELENNKIGIMFVKGLSEANKLQKNIAIDNLKYDEVEIEASIPPSVTLIFHEP